MTLTQTLGLITGLFVSLLVLKSLTRKKYCALCVSVTLTWIILLTLNKLGTYDNILLIGILIGQTTHGIYKLTEQKTRDALHLYRLPYLLTLITLAYALLANTSSLSAILLLALTWIIFILIGQLRTSKGKALIQKIIDCCKNW